MEFIIKDTVTGRYYDQDRGWYSRRWRKKKANATRFLSRRTAEKKIKKCTTMPGFEIKEVNECC